MSESTSPIRKLNAKELAEFSEKVRTALIINRTWRAGQAMFNCLYELRPDLANHVRGTQSDPFYNNGRISAFFREICDSDAIVNINPKLMI